MTKIIVTFVDDFSYVWVKPVPKPPTGGHKALKNEDFIDHDDLMFRESYYKQITQRQIRDQYMNLQPTAFTQTPQQATFNKLMGIGKRHAIEQVPTGPLRHVPIIED